LTWYFADLARFRAEREGVEAFAQEVDWLGLKGWRIDDRLCLVLDADVEAAGRIYPIYLRYPDVFPYTPPSVFPRGESGRWSSHQFGPGGELCLEYGPDTWTADLTGVDLIVSCHRLLELENPPIGERGAAPSRHKDTLGQRLRSSYGRFLLTGAFRDMIKDLPIGVPIIGNLVSAFHEEGVVHVVDKVTLSDGSSWRDLGVPPQLATEYTERPAPICRWAEDESAPSCDSLVGHLVGHLERLGVVHRFNLPLRNARKRLLSDGANTAIGAINQAMGSTGADF
jgi:sulfur-carrier protein adenylyltransferase/sulfurtransferase